LSIGQFYIERHFGRGASRSQPATPLQKVRGFLARFSTGVYSHE
jgi:polar amino acid transport system permease protein